MTKVAAVMAAVAGLVWLLQEGGAKAGGIEAVPADRVKWESIEGMPAGVKVSKVAGEGREPQVLLVNFAPGTELALHHHSPDHVVTVIRGSLIVGTEGRPDPARGVRVGAGGYFRIRGGAPHWTIAPEEAILVVSAQGPFDTKWEEEAPPRD